jgi:hypothetical protein
VPTLRTQRQGNLRHAHQRVRLSAPGKPAILPCSTMYSLNSAATRDKSVGSNRNSWFSTRPFPAPCFKIHAPLCSCVVTSRPNFSQRDAADQSFAATLSAGQHSVTARFASRGGVSARLSLGNSSHESLGVQCFPGKCHETPRQGNVPMSLPGMFHR